jgi:hypothetical protein
MKRDHLDVLLTDLRDKFELVLEDYAVLHTELLVLRRKTREQHELTTFLLKAVAADLAAHRADTAAHSDGRANPAGRPPGRPTLHIPHCPPG